MIKEQRQSFQNISETMSIGQTAIRCWLTQYIAEQNSQPGIGLLCPRNEMIYTVIGQLQKEAFPVQQSCDLLAVSRSGFYTAQHRVAKPAA